MKRLSTYQQLPPRWVRLIVSKVEVCVLKEVVVDLMPGMLNEGDGNIA